MIESNESKEPVLTYTVSKRVRGKREQVSVTEVFAHEEAEINAYFAKESTYLGDERRIVRCKCGEQCRWWTCEVLTVNREVDIPGCRMREILKRFRKFVVDKYRTE